MNGSMTDDEARDENLSEWPVGVSAVAERIRGHDWASTPLGPVADWPPPLRAAVELILGSPTGMVILWGPDLIQIGNDAYQALQSRVSQTALGQPLHASWPELRDIVKRVREPVLAGEATCLADQRLGLVRNGAPAERWFDIGVGPLRDGSGAVAGILVTMVEGTRRVVAERDLLQRDAQQSFRLQFGERLRKLTRADEIACAAAEAVGTHLEADGVELTTAGTVAGVHEVHAAWEARADGSSERARHNPSMALERTLAGKRPVAIADLASSASAHRDEARLAETGVRAVLEVPIIRLGEVVGALSVHQRTPRHWMRGEVALVQEVADRSWTAIALASSALALRRSEERYRTLFDALDEGFCVLEMSHDAPGKIVDCRFLDVNAAFPRQSGFTDAVGRTIRSIAPDCAAEWCRIFGEVARTGRPVRFERTSDGSGRSCEIHAFRIGAPGENRVGVLFNDIRGSIRALREREARYRLIVESIRDYAIFATDPQGRIEQWPPGAEAVFGWSPGEVVGRSLEFTFTPEDRVRAQHEREMAVARESGTATDIRWHIRKDGTRVFIEGSMQALRDERGELRGFLKIGQDVTARRQTEAALVRSERRLRTLIEGIPQFVWRARGDGHWTWSSPQWAAYTGLSERESRGLGWLAAVQPEDRDAIRTAWDAAAETQRLDVVARVRQAAENRYRWFRTRASPVRDEAGRIVEWLGTSTDVDDFRRLQEHQSVLVAELQHRVRNTLAVVRSIAHRTAARSQTVEDFALDLDGRIGAFARAQAAVTRDPTAGVDLEAILADELMVSVREPSQVQLEGPTVTLQASAAETLALALHELATNAVKHGALTEPAGGIRVTWRVETAGDAPCLLMTWKEHGVDLAHHKPERRGFGLELLEQMLPYQLDAEVVHVFEADGVRCDLRLPLTESTVRPRPEER